MPYTLIQPGMFDGLDSDCAFSIPAFNDNTRKIALLQSGVAELPTSVRCRPGDILYATLSGGQLAATTSVTMYGVLGAAVSATTTSGTVVTQLMGQAMVRSAVTTTSAAVGGYLRDGGSVYSTPVAANTVVGKITGVLDARHYEVLLHAYPDDVSGSAYTPGIPYFLGAQQTFGVGGAATFSTREAFVRWYDDAQGNASGKDNIFEVIGRNTLIAAFNSWNGDQAYATLTGSLLSGGMKVDTYNHVANDHTPQSYVYDIRPEVTAKNLILHLRSAESRMWSQISGFDAHIQIAGWWA